jgi:hypothetical protein
MFSIAKFFERIQNAQAKEVFLLKAIQDALKKHVGIDIPIENISCKSDSVSLKNVNSAAKSAIFIKKAAILKEINEVQQMRVVKDIR